MEFNVLKSIINKKEITIKDKIVFKTIFEVMSTIFSNKNNVPIVGHNHKINESEYLFFPNIETEEKVLKNNYGNYISDDWDYIYQFDGDPNHVEKRKKLSKKYLDNQIQLITFAKINDKNRKIGYHFIGVFVFEKFVDKENKIMIFKKISDSFELKWK